jgi:hypothetical protein
MVKSDSRLSLRGSFESKETVCFAEERWWQCSGSSSSSV